MTAEPYDDPFPEIVNHGGFTELEQQNIAELERLMKMLDVGGPEGGPVVLTMSVEQAKRLQTVLHHAIGHGCEEGLRATWAWLRQIVKPALDARLGGDGADND